MGTISSPSSTSSVTVSPVETARLSHTGRATERRSSSPVTTLASCGSRRPSRYLAVLGSRSTRAWRSSVPSRRSAVERWTPSSRATSAPDSPPKTGSSRDPPFSGRAPCASRSRIATARSTERITAASRGSLLTAQHNTIGVFLLDSEHQLGDAQQEGGPMSREEEIGRRFEKGDFFVPEMLIAARAMQGALVILRPLIAETGAQPVGRYVIGTVKGDIHDIGKNLCVIMLEGAGFEVFDLGVNTPPEKFVAAVEEHKPDVVGFSAFLTTTMPMFKVNIEAITKAGLRDKVHIAVGGAPVTEEYARHVGADSYAPDASMATRMAKEIVGDRSQSSQGAQALEQAVMKIDETLRKG